MQGLFFEYHLHALASKKIFIPTLQILIKEVSSRRKWRNPCSSNVLSNTEYTRVATATFWRTFHHDGKISPEAEFLDAIGQMSYEFSSLLLTDTSTNGFPPPPPPPRSKSGLKLVGNVNIDYKNLKSGSSQDYAQEPQRNCMFMNLASGTVPFLVFSLVKEK